ncbi:MAG: twin-arginine translocase subunit TatC [Deltaproteobacteria bacterium]|nr:twin-arginine translocase subunit TatC [Deltaproteobacteria bacterium]
MDPQQLSTHLEELRRRVFRGFIAVAIATIAAFAFAPLLFRWLLRPYHTFARVGTAMEDGVMLQTLQPAETLKMSVQLALVVGIGVVLPYLLYETWSFVRPGLTTKERRWLAPVLGGGTLLFCIGVIFAYYAVLPVALHFFWDYSLRLGITPAWSAAYYIGFVLSTLGAFGLAFELPLVMLLLAAVGLITSATLRSKRRYAYFIIAMLAALLTPPDALSMVLMGIPLIGLYELSVQLTRMVKPRSATPP